MIYENYYVNGEPFLVDDELFNVRASQFTIELYYNRAESNRLDKRKYIDLVGTISGALRNECNIIHPVIEIAMEDVPTFNYVYIPIFNRYYFVNEITSVRNGLWRFSMSVDVLMSYREQILRCEAFVRRNEYEFNELLNDDKVPSQTTPVIQYYEVENNVLDPDGFDGVCNFVLTVVG